MKLKTTIVKTASTFIVAIRDPSANVHVEVTRRQSLAEARRIASKLADRYFIDERGRLRAHPMTETPEQ